MIFDVENRIVALFDTSTLHQFSKFNHFLRVCWFLFKNLSNFVSPAWKLDNPYNINSRFICERGVDQISKRNYVQLEYLGSPSFIWHFIYYEKTMAEFFATENDAHKIQVQKQNNLCYNKTGLTKRPWNQGSITKACFESQIEQCWYAQRSGNFWRKLWFFYKKKNYGILLPKLFWPIVRKNCSKAASK